MSTTLYNATDWIIQYQLTSAYTAGSPSFVLSAGNAAKMPAAPFLWTMITASSYALGAAEVRAVYTITAVNTGNGVMTIGACVEGTDQNWSTTDFGEVRVNATYINNLNTQVTQNTADIATNVAITNTIIAEIPWTNDNLLNSSVTVAAGTGLAGGGSVALGDSITLSLSTPVSAASGGTGLTSLTAHSVLLGEGTSALGFATIGTANRVLADQGSGADPIFKTLTSLLDTVFGSAQGDVLYRGSAAWQVLTPGTNGQVLTTGGAAANVTWTTTAVIPVVAASGGTGLTTLTAHAVMLGEGTSTVGFATIGTANRVLVDQGAGADPIFQTETAHLDATFGSAQGNVLYRGSAAWQVLAPGTNGQVLTTGGAAANVTWATPIATPVVAASGGTGLATLTAHAVLLGEGTSTVGFATIGTANRVLADQGSGADPIFKTLTSLLDTVFGSAQGDVLYRGSSAWQVLTPGTNGQVLTTGGAAANVSWANSNGGGGESGTVTSVVCGAGLAGGTITTTGTVSLAIFAPTAVKTAAYNAVINDLIPVDVTSGTVVITLPTAPADKSVIAVKLIAVSGANVCTVSTGGSDVFNKAAGSTSLTLNATMQSLFLQYKSSGAIWYVVAGDQSSGGYVQGANVTITTSGGTRTIAASSGSGTVNNGTTGQLGYYAANGTTISGAPSISSGTNGELVLASIAAPASPTNGAMWNDSTQGCFTRYSRGMKGYSRELVYRQLTPVTVNTNGATSLINGTNAIGSSTLVPNALNVLGRAMIIKVRGYASTPAATAGSLTLFVKLGSNIFATTPTIAQLVNKTKLGFVIEIETICKTTGVNGTLDSTGLFYSGSSSSTPLTGSSNLPFQNGTVAGTQAPDTNVTTDLTASQAVDVQLNYTLTTSTFVVTSIDFYLEA